jgi:ATP-dependent RNA helicase HelY
VITPFTLDRFQVEAIDAIDRGESVLVAAPTGAGKTVVAEHAIERARRRGRRTFYTTPIKALSNQKFHDLVDRYGPDEVGLLTGDNAINGDAPVVVMTTEVLRNMLYAGARAVASLDVVVLDEVHYLQDTYRGPVWEEVITHLPTEIALVCLSATVSNADELAGWLRTVRGPTALIVEHHRPVELDNLYLVGDKTGERLQLLPILVDGRPNPEGERFDNPPPGRATRGRPRRRWFTPHRVEVIDVLTERTMLPAIYFIFSRNACNDSVATCLAAGVRLTDRQERQRIAELVEPHLDGLSDDDLDALGYDQWITGLEAGIAAHHAGMVPPFKEAVEACFVEGLVKVVFATETLALGINMPARSVVIEKLTKFTGEHHEFLTPGQYTQFTGRAGRRGIDDHGHAVVLWSPWVGFADVASLASSRSFPLTSAFRPTYNMAANLVRRYEPAEAHRLLNLSFAQYQTDNDVVRLETRLAKVEGEIAALEDEATCERGDVAEYGRLRERHRNEQRAARAAARLGVEQALRQLSPGDVVREAGRPVVVLSVAERKSGALRVRVLPANGRPRLLASDLDTPPPVLTSVELPVPFAPDDRQFQRTVAERLVDASRTLDLDGGPGDDGAVTPPFVHPLEHPVAACPDAERHLRARRRLDRARHQAGELQAGIRGRTESLARQFDRVLGLLEAWGYLDGWTLTTRGERLVRIFHECDLLVAEAMESGLLDGLDPATLAGIVSCFVYEHRSADPPAPPWFPSGAARHRFEQLSHLAGDLQTAERDARLPLSRLPDPTFFPLAHAWAAGGALDDVLSDEDLSGGDFVRTIKQLVDLLRQLGDADRPGVAAAARAAADALFRGVVAASSVVTADPVSGTEVDG